MIYSANQIKAILDQHKVWLIAKESNDKTYFVRENSEVGTIRWTQNRKLAASFKTPDKVRHFLTKILRNRKDVYLVHTNRR